MENLNFGNTQNSIQKLSFVSDTIFTQRDSRLLFCEFCFFGVLYVASSLVKFVNKIM